MAEATGRTGRAVAVAAAVLALMGCRFAPPPAPAPREGVSYDPAADPLVNPPEMFEPPPANPQAIAYDDALVRTLEGSPNTLNPLFMSSTYAYRVAELLFDTLIDFDRQMRPVVNPHMVESLEISEDHRGFTVRLREGLRWHDGAPLDAADVVFSLEMMRSPHVPCAALKSGREAICEVAAVDRRTVRIVLSEPVATWAQILAFPIIPRHIYEKHLSEDPTLTSHPEYRRYNRAPVGNGPYRFVEWVENDRIELERWEGYAGPRGHFREVTFRILPDAHARLLALETGVVDEAALTAGQFIAAARSEAFARHAVRLHGTQWKYSYIGWNLDGSNPFFGDVRVRRAMTHALDVERIIRQVHFGLAQPALGIFHPDSWMFNGAIRRLGYDPARAEALLDEAGWRRDPQTGQRVRRVRGEDGVEREMPLAFTLLIPANSPTGADIAAIFAEDLRRMGVEMRTQTVEWATFERRQLTHDFEACLAAWATGSDPDSSRNVWTSEAYANGRNYVGYRNSEVDRLYDEGRREFDPQRRAEIYRRIQQIIYEEQPYTFIVYRPVLWGIARRIRGVASGPRGPFEFVPGARAWWVPAGQALRRED